MFLVKLFCGEKTFMNKVSFPRTPFLQTLLSGITFIANNKSNSAFFINMWQQ
jgi:hypothetical protein